ncbi:MAG: Dabb family protein [Clostridia bacterium]|nr:Dabb family protein [Clostridia bacterium]
MVKHVILWTLKPDFTDAEKNNIKQHIKMALEGLSGKIPGLREIKVNINPLPSSNAELMLDSLFDNEESLKSYSTHPQHVAVSNKYVRPYTATRTCMDYTI